MATASLAERVRWCRKECWGISEGEAAARASTSQANWHRWETGTEPSYKKVLSIAEALGVHYEWLLHGRTTTMGKKCEALCRSHGVGAKELATTTKIPARFWESYFKGRMDISVETHALVTAACGIQATGSGSLGDNAAGPDTPDSLTVGRLVELLSTCEERLKRAEARIQELESAQRQITLLEAELTRLRADAAKVADDTPRTQQSPTTAGSGGQQAFLGSAAVPRA